MLYEVNREENRVMIVRVINDIKYIGRRDMIEINDDKINDVILENLKSKTVCLNNDGSMSFSDELFYDIPVKDVRRVNLLKNALSKRDNLIGTIDMVTYIEYIDINNELAEFGIFITDDNREEKYLEILETGDEHKIDLLEDLLILKDQLSVIKSAKGNFDKILEEVRTLKEDDIEELNRLRKTI